LKTKTAKGNLRDSMLQGPGEKEKGATLFSKIVTKPISLRRRGGQAKSMSLGRGGGSIKCDQRSAGQEKGGSESGKNFGALTYTTGRKNMGEDKMGDRL